jgi:hypothetical protein
MRHANAFPSALARHILRRMISTDTRRRVGRLAVASSALLLATPALAARDLAPTVSIDPATHVVTVSGPHHAYKPVLNLIRTDWWLDGTIADGAPRDPTLMVAVDLPGWAALDSATDAAGVRLAVTVRVRAPSTTLHGENNEQVAIALPRAYAEQAEADGLALTVAGSLRSFAIVVPGKAIRAFLTGYDAALAAVKNGTPAAAARPPAAPPPPSASAPIATVPPADSAPPPSDPLPAIATPLSPLAPLLTRRTASVRPADTTEADSIAIGSLGIVIEPTADGAMLRSVAKDSVLVPFGVGEGDFIEAVDGRSIKGLPGKAMAERIGAPGTRTLNFLAVGAVPVR